MPVTITWIAAETATQPEGGDVVDMGFASLVLDGSVSERYVAEASATEHPVESAVDIADHIKVGLRQLTIEAVVSAHPGPSSAANVEMAPDEDPSERPALVRAQLEWLRTTGTEVEIETPVGLYESMLILSVQEERTVDSGDGFRATIAAREFRRVSTEEVDAPSPRVERGRRAADSGRQTPAAEPQGVVNGVLDALANPGDRSRSRVITDALMGGQA